MIELMHLRNLKVFCDVVGRHSFSKAAADNSMTQSGASQAVQHLEDHLQVQLIDRSKRPFVLTAEGPCLSCWLRPIAAPIRNADRGGAFDRA